MKLRLIIMRSLVHSAIILALSVMCVSCSTNNILESMHSGETRYVKYLFLPGDCLVGNCMKLPAMEGDYGFIVILDNTKFGISEATVPSKVVHKDYDIVYSELNEMSLGLFDAENASVVNAEYKSFCGDLFKEDRLSPFCPFVSLTSLFFDGAMSITADRSFAGRNTGEDLSDLFYTTPLRWGARQFVDFSLKSVGLEEELAIDTNEDLLTVLSDGKFPISDFLCAGRSVPGWFEIRVDVPDKEDLCIIDQDVTLTVTIPVKVGNVLDYLLERETDPNAAMNFRRDTLVRSVTLPWRMTRKVNGHPVDY